MFNFNEFKTTEISNLINNNIIKIKKFDDYFFKNRDKKRFKVAKKCNRTIIMEFGKITFNRRIYFDELIKDYICFTDQYFNIDKRAKISNDLKQDIIQTLGSGKRYRDIKDEFKYSTISKVSIHQIMKKANLELETPKEKIKVNDDEYIYINVDDCFQPVLNEQRKKETCKIRVVSFNTGIDKFNSRYKNVLKNKRTHFIYNDKYMKDDYQENKLVSFVWKKMNDNYIFYNPKIVVGGDGAIWIRNLAKTLGAYYVFDRYHALRYLWTAYKPNIGKRKLKLVRDNYINYKTAKNLFITGKYNELINFLEITKVDKQTLSIFKTNKNGIINQAEPWNIGVSAESDIFHLVKSLKGNGAKIYNSKVFENMLIARSNFLNLKV